MALMTVVNSLWNIPYRTDNAKQNLQWNGINYGCKKYYDEVTIGLTATNTLIYYAKELTVKSLWNMPQKTDSDKHTNLQC
jgi:hypothetical protein